MFMFTKKIIFLNNNVFFYFDDTNRARYLLVISRKNYNGQKICFIGNIIMH